MENEISRLSRLTSILIYLQSKRLITAKFLAEKFNVSTRTIYRDIRALEKSGIPILTEEGRGFVMMEGYKIAPVMFTEDEANALITAELIIQSSNDQSLINEFENAIRKVKAGLPYRLKDRIEDLQEKCGITKTYTNKNKKSSTLLPPESNFRKSGSTVRIQ